MTFAARIADQSGHPAATQVLEELPDGVVVLGTSGVIEGINHAFLTMTGLPDDQVVGQRLESFVAEEDMLCLIGFEAMFGAARVEDVCVMFVAPDGSRRPLSVCSTKSRDGLRVLMLGRLLITIPAFFPASVGNTLVPRTLARYVPSA